VILAAPPAVAILAGNGGETTESQLASVISEPEVTTGSTAGAETQATAPTTIPAPDPTTSSTDAAQAVPVPPSAPPRILAVGDSVMAGASPALQAAIPGITVDASVARQFGQGVDAVRWWMTQGEPFDVVVVHLGTNGAFGDEQLDELVAAAGSAQVIFLEASAPRPWIGLSNERLTAGATRNGAQFVPWTGAVAAVGGPGQDGIHLGPSASAAYANEIAVAVAAAVAPA
jgi:hypothetical protein